MFIAELQFAQADTLIFFLTNGICTMKATNDHYNRL